MQTDSISFKNYDYKVVDYLSNLAPFPTQADKDGLTEAALKKFMPCAEYIASVLENIGVEDIELTDEGCHYPVNR